MTPTQVAPNTYACGHCAWYGSRAGVDAHLQATGCGRVTAVPAYADLPRLPVTGADYAGYAAYYAAQAGNPNAPLSRDYYVRWAAAFRVLAKANGWVGQLPVVV